MQYKSVSLATLLLVLLLTISFSSIAQVSAVQFGKNRIQYKKFSWKFYQSPNFNVYYNNEGGEELAKYVAQAAENELPQLESSIEYSLQRRANLILYNNYEDYKTTNIGLGYDWQTTGALTKLVNNKVPIYFNGDHNKLLLNIREGIAQILVQNILFGDDIGEFASNQALLDLPKWLTDGYIAYEAQNWSTEKDDELKNVILSGTYTKFYQFAFDKPTLAGNAFWYYIARKYKPQNVTYFLYLARLYKNLNTASERICKKKFKDVLVDFMNEEGDRYLADIKQRRNAPKGKLSIIEDATQSDFYHFASNPNPKNNSYAVVQYTKGKYCVKFVNNLYEPKILLEYGVNVLAGNRGPNYPILSWDGKGTRLLCIYPKDGKINMFVYDVVANLKRNKQTIDSLDQILDAGYIFDANTLLLSAVKNGHTDLFTYRMDMNKLKQITNDVYDDIDPTFVAFPNRLGIIFASNRPGPNAPNSDTVLPSRNRYNIFLADINNNSEFRQITQLTNLKHGNARYPSQYNTNHFTYVSDENGIGNRWAGFFSTETGGLDTLYFVGDEVLHNPTDNDLDSSLQRWNKFEADSIGFFKVYEDSTYTFPITNYQSSLIESRTSGNNDQVSELRREGDLMFLYKLKVDSVTLRKRNINARPTQYIKDMIVQEKLAAGNIIKSQSQEENKTEDIFQNEFEDNSDSSKSKNEIPVPANQPATSDILSKTKQFTYKLKFEANYISAGFFNNVPLVNTFQPYQGGGGPIQLSTGSDLFNPFIQLGVNDILEDIKINGGIKLGSNLSDKDLFVNFENTRKRIDWGVTYYRSKISNYPNFFKGDFLGIPYIYYDNLLTTNLYQFNFKYPFNEIKSFRASAGVRSDRGTLRPFLPVLLGYDSAALRAPDSIANSLVTRFEYVHDNSINPSDNIWNGLRWKIYTDFWLPVSKGSAIKGNKILNVGFDARYYYKIYRNFIWAVRGAGDFSFGDAKMIYYLGGADGWVSPKFSTLNTPDPSQNYVYQSLALNLRGFQQNIANGNNALVLNSELRLPVFATFIDKPINSAFLRNFQIVQFIDLGTAWAGDLKNIKRPIVIVPPPDQNTPVFFRFKAGGIGPFAGGYGFGARSTLLGYFMKLDAAWQMNGLFRGGPTFYFSFGFDF